MIRGDEYLETQVMTAPPHQLHLMVVDGAIRFAQRGAQALQEHDFEAAHFALNSSREFVSELIAGLDASQSPELVERLRALFAFVYRSLAMADLHHDVGQIGDALKILEMHREAWRSLMEQLPAEKSTGGPHAPTGEARSWMT